MEFHHICIIAEDYRKTIDFYVNTLGFSLKKETYSSDKKRKKLELYLKGKYLLEIFIFDEEKNKYNESEKNGINHISFLTDDIEKTVGYLKNKKVKTSEIMTDLEPGCQYVFFYNPDGIKHEIYSMR